MAGKDDNSDLLLLNQQLLVVQELIKRARKRERTSAVALGAGVLVLIFSVACWFIFPAGQKFTISVLALLVGGLSLAYGILARIRPGAVANSAERDIADLEEARRYPRPELELKFALLREERRTSPGLAAIDHKLQFKEDIVDYIDELRIKGTRNRRANHAVQVTTIVGSLAATAISSLALALDVLRWVSIFLTFAVGVAAGLAAYFKFRERSFYSQQTANAIEQEVASFNLGIGRYKRYGGEESNDALVEFLQEVHRLQVEQKNREQDLDEPARKSTDGE
ncbi:DUF4231 domain-containing protein [Kibdelosporangium lantanae]|uniref:DUF4231 domain-containing protein n=1 Tax=Kibdelosporangium lantanae TaxID=1497396 RepID=A0ABW3M0Q9_9PSEU